MGCFWKGVILVQVSATEFKTNLGKYLQMAAKQDIYITKHGRNIAKLTRPTVDKMAVLDELVGTAQGTEITLDGARQERLERL